MMWLFVINQSHGFALRVLGFRVKGFRSQGLGFQFRVVTDVKFEMHSINPQTQNSK